MAGDYPSTVFTIYDEGDRLRIIHLQTGMEIVTVRPPGKSLAVSSAFTIETAGTSQRPRELAQAALRHLRVWLIRRHEQGDAPGSHSEAAARCDRQQRQSVAPLQTFPARQGNGEVGWKPVLTDLPGLGCPRFKKAVIHYPKPDTPT
jgi:hypothetical protein